MSSYVTQGNGTQYFGSNKTNVEQNLPATSRATPSADTIRNDLSKTYAGYAKPISKVTTKRFALK